MQLHRPLRFITLSARAVELIAKPGKSRSLRVCIREEVMSYLRQRHGFEGSLHLTSPKEPRLNLVLTFWKTEEQAGDNSWEESATVRHLVCPLADVCRKVQTYEAALPDSEGALVEWIRSRAS